MSGQDQISELRSYWSSLDDQWSSTRGRWHDGTTVLFGGIYWENLELETRALEPAARQLVEVFGHARSVARAR